MAKIFILALAVFCFQQALAATYMETLDLKGLNDGYHLDAKFLQATAKADPNFAQGYFLTDAAKNGAVCLDGTPAAYYYKKGTGSGANKWYIHHQGGGWCESVENCYERSKTNLGSSKAYPANISLNGGYFSNDPNVNPMMYNWNMIFMNYCDGMSFSGNNASTTVYSGVTLHWRGGRILDAVIDSVLNERGAKDGDAHVISGCSAGGLATFFHCDYWAEAIATAGRSKSKTVCMPDSGFFMDYQGPPQYHTGMMWAFVQQNSTKYVNQGCIAAHQANGNEAFCAFAQHNAPFIKTPMFPLQSVYDSWQTTNILGLQSSEAVAFNEYGLFVTVTLTENLLATNPKHGVFLDSCHHHCGEWGNIRINGSVQATAFQDWFNKGSEGLANKGFYNQNMPYPCDACCHA